MAGSKKNMSDGEWNLLGAVGELFKKVRLEANMSQSQAAKAVGMSQARVPVLENGQADIMLVTLNRWANVYGYAVQLLLVPIEDEFEEGKVA